MRKTLWTLNINGYSPEITAITFPLMKFYADKCGMDFQVISERKFPQHPITYEKLQIHELGRGRDWNMFLDADALVHPECIDFTEFLTKDTVAHNGTDCAPIRWKYDNYFRRDGRRISSCNWLAIGSDWCLDLWKPLDDLTAAEAHANIYPTVGERNTGLFDDGHLIDDYTLSRNIAKFGLKVTTVPEICQRAGLTDAWFFWHIYTNTVPEKLKQMRTMVRRWRIGSLLQELSAESLPWLEEADEASDTGSPKIAGWMTDEECSGLSRFAAGKDVLEIGAYLGRSTVCMARKANHVTSVDTFDGRSTPEPRDTLDEFCGNLKQYGVADAVTAIKSTSANALAKLDRQGKSFDLCFIDGAHDYKSVLADIKGCVKLLRPGGRLLFHDYRPGWQGVQQGEEVVQAVDRLLANGAKIIEQCGSLALVQPAVLNPNEQREKVIV